MLLHSQGVDPSNAAAVEKLILDKLAELAETGFTPGAIEAAVNTIEFSLRENNTGSFPRGLSLMLRAVGAWIYGRDPYTPIQVWHKCEFRTGFRLCYGTGGPARCTSSCMLLSRLLWAVQELGPGSLHTNPCLAGCQAVRMANEGVW